METLIPWPISRTHKIVAIKLVIKAHSRCYVLQRSSSSNLKSFQVDVHAL